MKRKELPKVCHCGSGKLPGIMREKGWCCAICHHDRHFCPGVLIDAQNNTLHTESGRLLAAKRIIK